MKAFPVDPQAMLALRHSDDRVLVRTKDSRQRLGRRAAIGDRGESRARRKRVRRASN